jgi:hypothetical protein
VGVAFIERRLSLLILFIIFFGSTFSEDQQQEQGVPQGSKLSVTLFGLKINNIASALIPGIDCSLYSNSSTLLKLYRSLIRSKLDYGSVVYGSARKTYLQMLDTIHHQGLRLVLGAFRTSPVESLYAEAGEPSLHLRRKKLSLQYATRISSNSKNPANKNIFKPSYTEKIVNKPKEIKQLGLRLRDD